MLLQTMVAFKVNRIACTIRVFGQVLITELEHLTPEYQSMSTDKPFQVPGIRNPTTTTSHELPAPTLNVSQRSPVYAKSSPPIYPAPVKAASANILSQGRF